MDQACLVKITDVGFILLHVYGLGCIQKELGQYLVTLTSCLVYKPHLLHGQLYEWTRWTKSCPVIGYISGQDGTILTAFCKFMDLNPISVINMQKKELVGYFANIQPSWPHAWSITHKNIATYTPLIFHNLPHKSYHSHLEIKMNVAVHLKTSIHHFWYIKIQLDSKP